MKAKTMMNNNKMTDERGARTRRLAVLALSGYSVIAAAALAIFGKLLPAPLAEYMALTYALGKGGRIFGAAPFALLYLFYIALCVWVYLGKGETGKIPRVIMAGLLAIDVGIHAYVFLAASGYQWNYLASAALDMILIVCVLYDVFRRESKGEEAI